MDIKKIQDEILSDSLRWFGADVAGSLTDVALGLCGEAGEFADIVKKMMRGDSTEKSGKDLALELIDVFIYVLKGAALLKIDLESVYDYKRQFNEARFGGRSADEDQGVIRSIRPDGVTEEI